MKILLCHITHSSAALFIREAVRMGYVVFEENRHYCINIFSDSVYRSPDAIFKEIGSGLYIFEE